MPYSIVSCVNIHIHLTLNKGVEFKSMVPIFVYKKYIFFQGQ